MIALYPPLIELTGSHAAATVLSQIIYWHKGRLRVQRKGLYWLAKSRAEMCRETGITLRQYKRIIPALIQQDLIIVERGLFQNKVTPFIRLTDHGVKVANRLGLKVSNQLVPKGSNGLVPKGANLYSTEITTESTSDLAMHASPERGEEVPLPGEDFGRSRSTQIDGVGKKGVGETMRAREILKAHQAPLKGNLGAYWKSCVALVDDTFQHHLTVKELGQLKMLSKFLGERTRPVIAYAVEHWYTFASKAGNAANTSWPPTPNIGFLLKHYHVAVNLLKPEVPLPVATPLQPIAPAASEPAAVHKLTPQELTELLDGLKSSP